MSLALIYLMRAANGPAPHATFLSAYRQHAAGPVAYMLVLACKGYGTAQLGEALRPWTDLQPLVLDLPDVGLDLGSYRRASAAISSEYVCLMNSYSRPLAPGWLRLLHAAASRPGVGIAGATGSLEQTPHVRTNAFCMRRSLFLETIQIEPNSKADCYTIEHGPRSITQQVRARGLAARIVNRAGQETDLADARESRTFRWGNQDQLLVADNQTDSYARSDRGQQLRLQRLAWGREEPR